MFGCLTPNAGVTIGGMKARRLADAEQCWKSVLVKGEMPVAILGDHVGPVQAHEELRGPRVCDGGMEPFLGRFGLDGDAALAHSLGVAAPNELRGGEMYHSLRHDEFLKGPSPVLEVAVRKSAYAVGCRSAEGRLGFRIGSLAARYVAFAYK